jgi:hypothetical protein
VCAAVAPILSNVRVKAGELYGKVEPTVGPYVDQAGAALGRLAANLRNLAAEATDRLLKLARIFLWAAVARFTTYSSVMQKLRLIPN